MTSTVEIFKTELTPDKNAKIDNIDAFLNNPTYSELVYSCDAFQYLKISLDMEISITAKQENFNTKYIGNYARVKEDGKTFYFFILDSEWLSANACNLMCSLDTINTFMDNLELSDKTNVFREHRDRFVKAIGYPVKEVSRPLLITFADSTVVNETYNLYVDKPLTQTPTIESFYTELLSGVGRVVKVEVESYNAGGFVKFKTEIHGVIGQTFKARLHINVKYQKSGIKRVIDKVPEQITPALYGEDIGEVRHNDDNDNWYLIYNTMTTTQPKVEDQEVETLLCSDKQIVVHSHQNVDEEITLPVSDLTEGKMYIVDTFRGTGRYSYTLNSIGWKYDKNYPIIGKDGSEALVYGSKDTNERHSLLAFYKDNNQINCRELMFDGSKTPETAMTYNTYIKKIDKITLSSKATFSIYILPYIIKAQSLEGIDIYNEVITSPTYNVPDPTADRTIAPFEYVNSTYSTLMKIIKLPYCPIEYTVKNDVYYFNDRVQVVDRVGSSLIKIPNSVEFGLNVNTSIKSPLTKVNELLPPITESQVNEQKNITNESKLYNSEFYRPKFIYDSFGFYFDLEKAIPTSNEFLKVSFTPSRMFNSAFMFKFDDYLTGGQDAQDFNNILIADRNNEMPIYSSAYLDYIRTGYNYDVKARKRAVGETIFNVGASALTAGWASIPAVKSMYGRSKAGYYLSHPEMLSGHWRNPETIRKAQKKLEAMKPDSIAIATQIGQVSSLASNIISGVDSIIQSQENLDRRLEESSKQSVSVSTTDSVDLLQKYSNNKAKIKLYKASEPALRSIYDLFYYLGYNTTERKVPNTNSRYWFNFIQCEPVFKGSMRNYEPYLEDIKQRYAQGVTVYHDHNGVYDLDQEKENWETNLFK